MMYLGEVGFIIINTKKSLKTQIPYLILHAVKIRAAYKLTLRLFSTMKYW